MVVGGGVDAVGAEVMVRWEVLPLGSYKARRFGTARGPCESCKEIRPKMFSR